MLACYSDRLSAHLGERVRLFASSDNGPCRIEIARVGARREIVLEKDGIEIGAHPVPAQADRKGCGWPEAFAFAIGADWRSGYYDIVLTDASGETAHHFVCVKAGAKRAKAVLVLATNTLHAYNYWGGACAYCDVDALMNRRVPLAEAMQGAIGVLSAERPFAQALLAAPDTVPRLVNLRKRGFEERSWAGNHDWSRAHRPSPYDSSAGFLNKWEHAFVRWAEAEGIAFDYLTDFDLDQDASALDGYGTVLLVGHSEYWSGPERDAIENFVDRGGRLAIFSGNTAFWKVRWENGGKTLVCHKWKGETAERVAAKDATHLWSHPMFARPEAQITGLSFVYGGYHRLGMCAARGQGSYTVWRDTHWALAGTDLYYGDVFGDDVPLVGYENDGCPLTIGDDGLPAAAGGVGVPGNLEVIASVPVMFGEPMNSPYRPLIPPEQLDVIARVAFGKDDPETQARVLRGHAVMASFRRGKGEVFNCGTTEWAHGLAARDPFVEQITRNVLARFAASS